MTAKNRTFYLKNHELDKFIKAPADTLNVAPGRARLRDDAVLDFSACRDLKVLNLVGADLRCVSEINFPPRVGTVNCMTTVFPENFVMDLREVHRLSALNIYYAKNLKEVIISNKVPREVFYKIAQDLPNDCSVVVRRENGEVGYKGKQWGEYAPLERASSHAYLQRYLGKDKQY